MESSYVDTYAELLITLHPCCQIMSSFAQPILHDDWGGNTDPCLFYIVEIFNSTYLYVLSLFIFGKHSPGNAQSVNLILFLHCKKIS